MRFRNVWNDGTVVAARDVAANVRLIELEPAHGGEPYTAGAHIDVSVLSDGRPELRSYSLVGVHAPGEPYRIAVKRLAASRGGSAYMWSLAPGARLAISQPQNHFPLPVSFEVVDHSDWHARRGAEVDNSFPPVDRHTDRSESITHEGKKIGGVAADLADLLQNIRIGCIRVDGRAQVVRVGSQRRTQDGWSDARLDRARAHVSECSRAVVDLQCAGRNAHRQRNRDPSPREMRNKKLYTSCRE